MEIRDPLETRGGSSHGMLAVGKNKKDCFPKFVLWPPYVHRGIHTDTHNNNNNNNDE